MYPRAVLMCCGFIVSVLEVNCSTCPTTCRSCTNTDDVKVCTVCNDGYWLLGSSCQPCLNNCATCFNASSCGTCKPGFYSSNSACHLSCSTHCWGNVCDENTGHCLECPSDRYGYYCDHECRLCKNEQCDLRKCTNGCNSGYWQYQSEGSFECKVCMVNCSLCNSWPICNVCHDGTYLSEFNELRNYCFLCPYSCANCSSYSSCSTCKPGYIGNACEYQCSDIIPDCVICDWDRLTSVSCRQCANGLTLQDSYCLVSSQQCPINCVRCTRDNVCELCKEGWIGELCDKSCYDIPYCVACQEEGGSIVCNVCVEGYAVMDGECRTIASHVTSTMTAPSVTTTKTSKSEPPVSEYKTPTTQQENTSFQTSTLIAGIFIGIGISICAILLIGLVWFIRKRYAFNVPFLSEDIFVYMIERIL